MKLLGMVYMAAGLLLTFFVLKLANRDWKDFGPVALWAAGFNGGVGVMAFLLIRRGKETGMHWLLLILGYLAGIAGGTYFYYT